MSASVASAEWRDRLADPPRRDLLLAFALAVVALLQVLWFLPIASRPVGALVAVVSTAPLAWRRVFPVAAALVGSLIWLVPTDGFLLVGYVAAFFLFYSVAAHVRDQHLVAATALIGTTISVAVAGIRGLGIGEYAGSVLAVVAPAGVGLVVRRQRLQNQRLEELTLHLQQERDRQAQAAVADERARIARELHDLVSHAVTVVAVQADAAEAALGRDPELAKTPLSTIRGSATEALTEMRRLLGVLRAEAHETEREPLPGLAQLSVVLDRARASGTQIEFAVEGTPLPLPPSVDLSAYRIVQEAVTNAVKHAHGAPVSIRLCWLANALEIEVRDEGPGTIGEPSPDAHGLVGMRERVRIHGGELKAGTADQGGFAVRALLPIETA